MSVVAKAKEALVNGVLKIKLKVLSSSYNNVVGVTQELHSIRGCEIMVDANGSFDPENEDHLKMLRNIDQLSLLMIEGPVSRVGSLNGIRASKKTKRTS